MPVPKSKPINSRPTQFVVAAAGWYAWYHNDNTETKTPTLHSKSRRPIIGWQLDTIPSTGTTGQHDSPETIVRIIPVVIDFNSDSIIGVSDLDSGHTFIGFEWPGMTTKERNALFDFDGTYVFVPTL